MKYLPGHCYRGKGRHFQLCNLELFDRNTARFARESDIIRLSVQYEKIESPDVISKVSKRRTKPWLIHWTICRDAETSTDLCHLSKYWDLYNIYVDLNMILTSIFICIICYFRFYWFICCYCKAVYSKPTWESNWLETHASKQQVKCIDDMNKYQLSFEANIW